jgi:hypothetical protein
MMPFASRILSASFLSLPVWLLGIGVFAIGKGEYYRGTYIAAWSAYLAASLLAGLILPPPTHKIGWLKSWAWLFLLGLVAWMVGLIVVGVLNLTPLCVGQDNGDGTNDLVLCLLYSILAAVVYSPLMLGILLWSTGIGGALLQYLERRRARSPAI